MVFVKLMLLQKLWVFKVLQGNGYIVGFFGDGINDVFVL